jgi:hypothetical protein
MTAVISSMTGVGSAYNLIVNASPLTPMESHASHGLKSALHTPMMVSHASQNPIPRIVNASYILLIWPHASDGQMKKFALNRETMVHASIGDMILLTTVLKGVVLTLSA